MDTKNLELKLYLGLQRRLRKKATRTATRGMFLILDFTVTVSIAKSILTLKDVIYENLQNRCFITNDDLKAKHPYSTCTLCTHLFRIIICFINSDGNQVTS